jgi:hypothetical protein
MMPAVRILLAAVLLFSRSEKFVAALAIYSRTLDGSPPVGDMHEPVAKLYERAGKPECAAAELRRVRRRSAPECAAHYAECDFLAGKFRASLAAALPSAKAVDRYWQDPGIRQCPS